MLYTSLRQFNRTVTASMLDTAGDISRIRWGKEKILASKVPKRIDWREKGVVGPVNEITHCASGTSLLISLPQRMFRTYYE